MKKTNSLKELKNKLSQCDSLLEKAENFDLFSKLSEAEKIACIPRMTNYIKFIETVDEQKVQDAQYALDASFILIDVLRNLKDNNEELKKSTVYVNYLESLIVELEKLDVSFTKITLPDDAHKKKIESALNKGKQIGESSVRQSGTDGNKKKAQDKRKIVIPKALELLKKPHDITFHPEDYRSKTLAREVIKKLNKTGKSGWTEETVSLYIKDAVKNTDGELKNYPFLLGHKPKNR